MKNLVVRSAQEFAYAYADFVAGYRGGQQVFARASQRLRHGDSRREDHGGRMKHRSVMDVVLLDHMRGGGIDHGREQRTGRFACDQVLGWAAAWARSEEHTSELQSLMRNSYSVFC